MNIKIKCFGLLAEAVQQEELTINLNEGDSIQELKDTLLAAFPVLEGKEFKVAVNKNIATKQTVILPSDELALLPPFAGG